MKIELRPIGIVKDNLDDYQRIEIYEDFLEALKGIENFKYLRILFWLHKVSEEHRKTLQVHPMGNFSIPKRGVFTTRSPRRPNPIGLTRVEFLKREGNIIFIRGLDALEGSPILDIKIA
ncbi:MAG: tRNA (N6-threonylcarbamoyladenosine(37)-N6)-methyltransferase TrmO [Candidatus Aerophobetes bacterium]|nr:tRNA (N6-threonylcarbamoyladenosine(37)-N6)-methyltransferase TrmO [Candidatus Aerophobetes bacterium]